MLAAIDCPGVDAVFGPVAALYGPQAPAWLRQADLHSTRPAIRADGRIDTGYTCNVLLRRSAVGAHRFDPALGRSGGEDSDFFHRLHRGGAELRFCPEGWVFEQVPEQRARLGWLVRRAFRSGQSHARTLAGRSGTTFGKSCIVAAAMAKAIYCFLSAGARAGSPPGWRRCFVRGALHVGVAARLLGKRDIQLY